MSWSEIRPLVAPCEPFWRAAKTSSYDWPVASEISLARFAIASAAVVAAPVDMPAFLPHAT
jgi:hypothetical protein